MQDQNQPVNTAAEQLAADVNRAEVLFFVWSDNGGLTTKGAVKHGDYQPEQIASHAYLQAVRDLHGDIMAKINGKPTDGDRFRALRDFADLASTDQERFEVVNGMLLKFESEAKERNEDENAGIYQTKVADFLCYALIETAPVLAAPTTEREPREDGVKIAIARTFPGVDIDRAHKH